MSLHRKNPRRDANEQAVASALRGIGCHVRLLSTRGVADLLVYRVPGPLRLIEVKTARGRLTPSEKQFGLEFPVDVVRTVAEALQLYGVSA